jgi:hypothetical protein
MNTSFFFVMTYISIDYPNHQQLKCIFDHLLQMDRAPWIPSQANC